MSNITMEEVEKHNTINDCWIVSHGKVYDVSSFINKHPGGKFVIKSHAGTEVSKHYNYHSKNAHKICMYHIKKSSEKKSTLWPQKEKGFLLDIFFLFFAHVSIWPPPPTQLVSKHQHFFTPPTHLFADVILEWSLN